MICDRCGRPVEPWILTRPDICSPPEWFACIRTFAKVQESSAKTLEKGVASAPLLADNDRGGGRRACRPATKCEGKKERMAKKLKIVRRSAPETARPAAAGSTRTGARVEKTKAGKGQPGSSAGRFIGKTSGLSVLKYQNQSLENNRKRRKDDETLAKEWRNEFPGARANYTAETVRGVRGAYNRGAHGADAPRVPVPEFNDAGEALPFRGEKAAAKREASDAKAAVKTTSKKKIVVKGRK